MKEQRGQTLVATMIVLVIIMILAVVFFKSGVPDKGAPGSRKDNLGTTMPGLVKLAAKDDVCLQNLGSIRDSIQIFRSSNGDEGYPEKLEDTKLSRDFLRCPIGKEPYVYEPATGKV